MTDYHSHFIAQLNAFVALDEKEEADRLQTLDFVTAKGCPDAYLRTTTEGHVYGSAFILSPDMTSGLMINHRFLKKWLQLGGHADGNANILEVALREAQEESGLEAFDVLVHGIFDIDVHVIPTRPERGEPEHLHYDIRYLLRAKSTDFIVNQEESTGLAWLPLQEIANLPQNSVSRMAKKAIHYLAMLKNVA